MPVTMANNFLYSSADYFVWSEIRERGPRIGRGEHQTLGVLLVSLSPMTVVSRTGLGTYAVFGVSDGTPSFCDYLKLRLLK